MSKSKSYTELEVWKVGRRLVSEVYELTRQFPKEELYGLSSQMRRCAVSIPSNVAEGMGRNHSKDTVQFLYIARGSTYELETQLYLASDQAYCLESTFDELMRLLTSCKQLLNGLINYYEKRHEALGTNHQAPLK